MKNHLIKNMITCLNHRVLNSDVQDMWDQLYYEAKEFENLKCYDEDRFTIDYELKI